MSDLLGLKTKKVTTYARRGNRTNIIPIHTDITPVKSDNYVDLTNSPTTPLKRPPLTAKSSHVFLNLQSPISPEYIPLKEKKPSTKVVKPSVAPSDSPRIIRRMHRPGRAIIPPSPSSYAGTPTRAKSKSKILCVEIPHSVGPPTRRLARSKLGEGQYRELSESIASGLDRILLSDPVESPTRLKRPLSPPAIITPALTSTLESVCSSPHTHSFVDILVIVTSTIHQGPSQPVAIVKAGEATYSEVYSVRAKGCTPLVMKVIPIKWGGASVDIEGESPYRSPAEDVAKEVEITKRMSGLEGGGFVIFHGAYIVQGVYDPTLLAQWDTYAETHGTENVRPSCFDSQQEYVVIFLRDGGDDLEAFEFAKKTGWVQAAGVFWQVADALARAEEWTEFEHRDLHEGQILIEAHPTTTLSDNPLNPDYCSIKATIIDFGLSRLRTKDQSRIISTVIPEDVLEGEGEQWDIYRAIDKRLQGDWEGYHPITNLLWLQYILTLLLRRTPTLKRPKFAPVPAVSRARSVRAVSGSKARTAPEPTAEQMQSEMAYSRLELAKQAIDAALNPRARRTAGGEMGSASDLVVWARSKGLVQ